MAKEAGFTSMAGARAEGAGPRDRRRHAGLRLYGQGAHQRYKKLPYMIYPPPAMPGWWRSPDATRRRWPRPPSRYGYEAYYTDWRKMLEDDRIQLFDNGGPNDVHAEPSDRGRPGRQAHLCEKPLGAHRRRSTRCWSAVEKAGVKHMVAFNYRFVPAIRLARDLIESGQARRDLPLPRRSTCRSGSCDPDFPIVWRLDKDVAGSGTLGDLGAHIIDLARYLVGEPTQRDRP